MKGSPIQIAKPDLSGNEESYVVEAIRSSWISSTGPFIDRFENDFAGICGVPAALSVANGTVALHLALVTLGVRPGDEVIVPSLTYVATANAVRYVSAVPVFVDVDPETWCLDPAHIVASITPRTKGIIAVHLYGHPADMDAINEIAAAHGLWVVEDAAEAPFATYKGRPTGGLATIGTFSFYGNKVISSGEGGAITISDRSLERHARMLRGQGMDPERRYYFPIVGYNFRLTNLACALLCAQLERREQILQQRRHLYSLYKSFLGDVPGVRLQQTASWAEISPWLFSIVIEPERFGSTRDELIVRLSEHGIESRPFFVPLHTLPPYRDEAERRAVNLAVSVSLGECGLNLPTYCSLSEPEVRRICDVLLGI